MDPGLGIKKGGREVRVLLEGWKEQAWLRASTIAEEGVSGGRTSQTRGLLGKEQEPKLEKEEGEKDGGGEEGCWTSFLDVHKTPHPHSHPSSGQWPGHCQGLVVSCRGCVPRRHSRERLRKGERSRRGSLLLSFCCVLGPVPGSSQTVSHLIIITTLRGRNPGFQFPVRKWRLRVKQFS